MFNQASLHEIYGEMRAYLHAFLTSVLDARWSHSHTERFTT